MQAFRRMLAPKAERRVIVEQTSRLSSVMKSPICFSSRPQPLSILLIHHGRLAAPSSAKSLAKASPMLFSAGTMLPPSVQPKSLAPALNASE